jgi:hypothetical protein
MRSAKADFAASAAGLGLRRRRAKSRGRGAVLPSRLPEAQGRCPYHPTDPKKPRTPLKLEDLDKSGSWNDEFMKELRKVLNEKQLDKLTILEYLEKINPGDKDRLFVHSSEFTVLK